MHLSVLVLGPNIDAQLERYGCDYPVEPRQTFMSDDDLAEMRDFYNRNHRHDCTLECLLASLHDWNDRKGGIEDGRLYYWETRNPDQKWDWYAIGGRYAERLKSHTGEGYSSMLAGDIDWDAMGWPTIALVAEGVWVDGGPDAGWGNKTESDAAWDERFFSLVRTLSPDTIVTIVDCHD